MALSFDIQTQEIIAEIQSEQTAERYECAMSVCPRPSCGCRVIQLDLSGGNDSQTPSRYVKIDLSDKSLEPMKKDNAALAELRFAKRFLAGLNDEDFELLSEKHFELKNRMTEETTPEEIEAHFDFRKIERNGVLSGYYDVLPFADRLHATVAGKRYRVLDYYCLQPQCLCTDANLSVVDIDESTGRGAEVCCIGVNYAAPAWKTVAGGPLALDPEELRSALEGDTIDIYENLRKRHARLKSIYAFNRKKYSTAAQPLSVSKISRNDLCPCGSGKKFKKCCAG